MPSVFEAFRFHRHIAKPRGLVVAVIFFGVNGELTARNLKQTVRVGNLAYFETFNFGGKRFDDIDPAGLDYLRQYAWPGNVRELQNVIERAVVLAEGETITVADLPVDLQNAGRSGSSARQESAVRQGSNSEPGSSRRDEDPLVERQSLIDALAKCGGNKARAARLLGLARSTYFSKLKKHGLADAEGNISHIKRLPR